MLKRNFDRGGEKRRGSTGLGNGSDSDETYKFLSNEGKGRNLEVAVFQVLVEQPQ